MPPDRRFALFGGLLIIFGLTHLSADQPQWGDPRTHNLVSDETGLPGHLDPNAAGNLRWSIDMGNSSYGTPVIVDGKVIIGGNNSAPMDDRFTGIRGTLLCLDEATGELIWQLTVPKLTDKKYLDWHLGGICSAPTVVGDHVYVVSNRAEVLCLDINGLADGNDGPFVDEAAFAAGDSETVVTLANHDADILWRYSMPEQLDVHHHDAAHSIILAHGDHLYLNTANGVDPKHSHIPQPDAPSLVVLDRHTGRLLATDGLGIGNEIFHCNWSSPVVANVDGHERILFCGGNGICYGFEPLASDAKPDRGRTLRKVWQFDLDPGSPKEHVHDFVGNRHESPTNVMSQPVVVGDRLFVSSGGDIWWGKNEASLQCIDLSGTGDVTKTNLLWRFPLGRHCSASPTIHDGLVYIGDFGRTFYCLDADSGATVWDHPTKAEFWSTALVADGKVYVGNKRGSMFVFEAGRQKNLISETQFETGLYGSPVASGGTLYISTFSRLFAFAR
ncbi:PQQ-binding-like beta-propeller repeat protein [Crateriforma spongiae]|uniref:outer membrane protein assembly factor BamB family protein n=1 Tax=Crateriforma spongiae TaxID=2724528 RepID=UPI0039B0B325